MMIRLTAASAITFAILAGVVFGLTPKEREKVTHARAGVVQGIEHNNLVGQQLQAANQAASDSATSAQTAGVKAEKAEGEAKRQHDELKTCATQNAEMRPIVKEVQSWWGIGGIIYGFKRLAVHVLILTAVLVVGGVLIAIFAPGLFKILGIGFDVAAGFLKSAEVVVSAFWSRAGALIWRKKPAPAPEPIPAPEPTSTARPGPVQQIARVDPLIPVPVPDAGLFTEPAVVSTVPKAKIPRKKRHVRPQKKNHTRSRAHRARAHRRSTPASSPNPSGN